jgi:hypothetical protein
MSARGPVPKRPDQRRRRNKQNEPTIRVPGLAALPLPADPAWHSLAGDLYESLERSGQSQFYEPSDWALARVLCELLSRQLIGVRLNANLISVIMAGFDRLLVAEGDRRRARLILEHGGEPEEAPSVAIMAQYKRAAGRKAS